MYLYIIFSMAYSSFSPDILTSPFISLDQIITSLTYSAQSLEDDERDFTFFLVPANTLLYPTCALGAVYTYAMNHPEIKRIVYL